MRKSGILMHITSLPGEYGVGSMGRCAFDYIDFLQEAGQRCWQILPLTPTGFGDSPYQSCSAFAGNPYLIDFPLLVEQGLLTKEQLDTFFWGDREDKVDFFAQYQSKLPALRQAFESFDDWQALDDFCLRSSSWLSDYALYMALKAENDNKPWYQWPAGEKFREPEALYQARTRLKQEIRFYSFVQYLFYTQWEKVLDYAHEKGISIIGDVPIYVPLDSCDVWAEPGLFQLDGDLKPTKVAGVPPDAFSRDGQLWGNPLYRWDRLKKEQYRWWLRRLRQAARLYDIVRLDHFRAFEAYWTVPYGAETAKDGAWEKGPGIDFFRTVEKQLPELQLIAEDLGFLTEAVFALRDEAGLPGMRVLQFAFDSREPSLYLPHTYIENTVCYTGTHDNMTLRQYLEEADPEVLAYAREYMGLNEEEGLVQGVIRTALSSVSRLCILQMQDYLDLGAEARMNFPGTMGDNWTWRAKKAHFTPDLARKMRRQTRLYGR
ncbi:MAG: 4-alpha-glucanotransferase [Oscillospiraceae bacterium]|nr:4-alpha-glucanotransferase [Oscillospiraceae bacterium]